MQLLIAELDRARAARAAADNQRAQDALDGLILGLEWAIEDGGRTAPSHLAAKFGEEPEPEQEPAPPEPKGEEEPPAEPAADEEEPAPEPPKPVRRSRRRA